MNVTTPAGPGKRIFFISAPARAISFWWCWSIRFVPLADIMFLARYWELGKSGALTSLIGLVLLLPMTGKALWDKKHPTGLPRRHLHSWR